MYDVITIGSATCDIFLNGGVTRVVDDKKSKTKKSIALDLGSKIAIDKLYFETGGGAVNSATTFANQELSVASIFKIGDDRGGDEILKQLTDTNVDILVAPVKSQKTAYSFVLTISKKGRTILAYRGVSEHLLGEDIPWDKLKEAKWLYISHLSGESAKQFAPLIKYAKKNNISVALNPGCTQLDMGDKIRPLLESAGVLLLNQEEASVLTGIPYSGEEKIFKKLDSWIQGIVVITKGPKGVSVSDGSYRWDAPVLKEPKYIDRTGAGDALGSGFVTALIKGKTIEDAIQLGSANATGVLREWGANKGLLTKNDAHDIFGNLRIKKRRI